jgi:plasmid stability protein
MSDILIRNVPDEVLGAIDAHAARLGLSRTEYLRRRLAQDAQGDESVSAAQLRAFGEMFADLGDATVMSGAWA